MTDSVLWADTAAELAGLAAREHVTQHDAQDAMDRAATVVRDLGRRAEHAEVALIQAGWAKCACGRWYARKGQKEGACLVCWVEDLSARKARAA